MNGAHNAGEIIGRTDHHDRFFVSSKSEQVTSALTQHSNLLFVIFSDYFFHRKKRSGLIQFLFFLEK